MKLRLTYVRTDRDPVDVAVTCDGKATVGDLARQLLLADPRNPAPVAEPPRLTIALAGGRQPETLDPATVVPDSGLRSGQRVTLAQAGARYQGRPSEAAAVVEVVAGPDLGKQFPLLSGGNTIGRARDCQVVLTDPMVSRQHLRINVTDVAEVIDLGSANGVRVNDGPVDRSPLRAGDRVGIGDTQFSVRMLRAAAIEGRVESTAVGFIRSPRLFEPFAERTMKTPALPERAQPQRFPMVTLLAPILMGAVLFLVTQQVTSLVFIALSPIMMLGSWLEGVLTGRKVNKQQLKQFRSDLANLVAAIRADQADEVDSRRQEHPAVADCVAAVGSLDSLLWCRRPDSPGFGEFRLGLGRRPSRVLLEQENPGKAPLDLVKELAETIAPLAGVDGVPVVVSPGRQGGVGVAGPRSASAAMARSLVVQAATLHTPNDLTICSLGSTRTAADWAWLKWLPHCATTSPVEAPHLANFQAGASRLLGEIEQLVESRSDAGDKAPRVPAVLLVVESDAPVEFARLVDLAEVGWRAGVYVLWVAPDVRQLPTACRVFLDAHSLESGEAGYLHTGELVTPLALEAIGLPEVEQWARRLAPVTDLATRSEDDSDLPRSVGLLSLIGPELATTPTAVIERWQSNRSIMTGPYAPETLPRKAGTLRAVVGRSAAGIHSLDLRADGPHALVGGTTGSGKSELLQTWILGMAANHSPQRLTFLLVDYKGGSAFADCNHLPHTVGLVTDLNTNGVRRALVSLQAELRSREHLLAQHKKKDLIELEKSSPVDAPPSLVIVVDEFAALVQEVPEFVDGVVNVAQRGRSLGLHLILATQRPAGVIKDNLRANTNLRLALRVADVDDSNDVLGSPQAAYFDQDIPGRAVSKTGPSRLAPFQTGYVGGHTEVAAPPADIVVEEVGFGPVVTWEVPAAEEQVTVDPGPADIRRLVDSIRAAHGAAALPVPRKPWLPDLERTYDLSDRSKVPTARRDDVLVFGVRDDPDNQAQPPVAFYPDVEGNMAIFGTGGSGKSTLLRTLAVAAGFAIHGGPCHVYGLDFGSRGLAMLEPLPHVGSIVDGGDRERVRRLLTWLRQLITDRAARWAAISANTITDYRRLANAPSEPRILLLLDGAGAFRTEYEGTMQDAIYESLVSIAAEGRPVGVHVVLTADRRTAVSTALSSSIQRRIVLRLSEADEYTNIGVSNTILTPDSPPGRSIDEGYEIQVAVLAHFPTEPERRDAQARGIKAVPRTGAEEQAAAINRFSVAMRRAGGAEAPPVRRLPECVRLQELEPIVGRVLVGMQSEGFGTASIVPAGAFVVSGPSGSGRTTAVVTIAQQLRLCGLGAVHLLTESRRTELLGSSSWSSVTQGPDAIEAALAGVSDRIKSLPARAPREAFVFEGYGELAGSSAEYALGDFVRVALNEQHFLLVEGEQASLGSAYSLMQRIKAAKRGLLLQPDDGAGNLVGAEMPRARQSAFIPGRGYLVERGMPQLVQVALPNQTGSSPHGQ